MRFIKPVTPLRAGGLVGQVYREVSHDFGLLRDPNGNSPWLGHSPHPEVLSADERACLTDALADWDGRTARHGLARRARG